MGLLQASDPSARPASSRGGVVACATVLALEALGSLSIWAMPLGWLWVGARVYDGTRSVALDGAVVLLGLLATAVIAMRALTRLDSVWIALRRRAGHDQAEGALTQVVVISATLAIALFLVWFYVLSRAFIMPFMPSV